MNARLLFPSFSSSVVVLGLAALVAVPASAGPGAVALGPEIVVRTIDEGPTPAAYRGFNEFSLAGHRDGSFAVAWTESIGGTVRVRMRRFSALGRPGRSFVIDEAATGLLDYQVDAVSDGRGGQVVAWQRRTALDGRIFDTKDLWAQFFPPGDRAPGPQRLVLTDTWIGQALTRLSGREFGVASSVVVPGFRGIFVGRFDRTGNLLGNTAALRAIENPVLVAGADGGISLVFGKVNVTGPRRADSQVMLQRIAPSGLLTGPRVAVSTLSADLNEYDAGAARLPGGGVVVVWRREGVTPASGFAFVTEVVMRRFDAQGVPISGTILVDGPNPLSNAVGRARVATDRQGRAVVVWQRGEEIHGRAYDASGAPLGESFRIDGGRQRNAAPQVGVAHDGTFVVVWEHLVRQPSLFARRFAIL